MYGAMYVVADLDAYLADPEGYLAGHPLPAQDELLKFNRPRKEWKFEEPPDTVKVIENPLAKATPLVLKKSDIADRAKAPTSIMPKGLLDKLTREEILDLIAFVASRGDPNSPLLTGGHGHAKH